MNVRLRLTTAVVLVALAGIASLPSRAVAATLAWDNNGTTIGQTDGAGAWLNANQWRNGAINVTWTSGDDAVFGIGGAGGAVTLAAPTTVNSISTNGFTGTYTLGTAGQTITLNNGITTGYGASTTTIVSPITLAGSQTWRNNARSSLLNVSGAVNNNGNLLTIDGNFGTTISGVISGAGGFTKNGSGTPSQGNATLTLTNANTYTGATTLNAGTLTLSGNGAINNTTAILFNGGNLNLVNAAQVNRIADGAAITSNGGAITYTNTSGANIYTETIGAVTLASGQLDILEATNQASTGSQTLTLGGLTHAASSTGTITFSANTTGPQTAGNKNMIVVNGGGTTAAGQIIGPWATVGTAAANQTDYAVFNGNFVTAANIAASAENTWTNPTNAYTLGGATTLTGTRTVNALRYNGAAATLGLGTNSLQTYGLLNGGTGVLTVSGTGALTTPTGGGNLFVTAGNNGITISAPITNNGGAVTLVKSGNSTVTLSGANSYTGGTFINAGTLVLNNSGALGNTGNITFGGGNYRSITNSATFSTGGVLQHSASNTVDYSSRIVNSTGPIAINTGGQTVTYGSTIAASNTGGLLKLGSGRLILSGANAYTGTTYVGGGTLQIDNTIASDMIIVGSVNATGQVLELGNSNVLPSNAVVQVDGQGVVTWDLKTFNQTIDTLTLGSNSGGTRGRVIGSGNSTLTVTSGVTTLSHNNGNGEILVPFLDLNGGTPIFTVQNGTQVADLTISSVIQNGAMRIDAQAGAKLGLLSANTFSGPTQVNVGALQLSHFQALQNSPLDTSGTGTVELIAGVGNYTLGGLIGSKDLATVIPVNLADMTTLTLNPQSGAYTYSGAIANGNMSLSKTGAGTQTLSGTNTYLGTTDISGGTLLINGNHSAATGAVTVNANGTLGGNGIVGGATTVFGTHAPGDGIGILSHATNLSYDGGASAVQWELVSNSIGIRGTDFDGVDVGGNLDFLAATTLDLAFDMGSSVDWTDAFWQNSYVGTNGWLIYDVAGTTSNFGNLSLSGGPYLDSLGNPSTGTFSLFQNGSDIYLNFQAAVVPEPASIAIWALILCGVGVRFYRGKRNKHKRTC